MNWKSIPGFIAILCLYTTSPAQVLDNTVYQDHIKTVRLYPSTNEIGLPVINFNSTDKLIFTFDHLGDESRTYYYTLVHCDYNWEPTIQNTYEYIDGFARATIDDYNYSANTRNAYINYKLEIPNNDMNITQSGNYALVVYEDSPDEPIITRRFMVAEKVVGIDPRITFPRSRTDYRSYHEVLFNVNHQSLNINNPYQEIKATVMQNQRWDNAYIGIAPRFLRNGVMDFDHNGATVFEAGREFRRFDIRSMRFKGVGVRAIQNNDIYLLFDQIRSNEKYFIETDYNGQYFIDVLEYRNRSIEADYAHVHFSLAMNTPVPDGKLYVGGTFNEYAATPENQLKWNPETNMYETQALLKQGYYDYIYYYMPQNSDVKQVSLTEGNDYDAENQYDIFIYYKAFGERYDRLIGYTSFNSRAN